MKKILLTLTALALIGSGAAMAQNYGIGSYSANHVSLMEAENIMMEVINSSTVDYALTTIEPIKHSHDLYMAEVTDGRGNSYTYFVGPDGWVSNPR